jgi:hypothetical protein
MLKLHGWCFWHVATQYGQGCNTALISIQISILQAQSQHKWKDRIITFNSIQVSSQKTQKWLQGTLLKLHRPCRICENWFMHLLYGCLLMFSNAKKEIFSFGKGCRPVRKFSAALDKKTQKSENWGQGTILKLGFTSGNFQLLDGFWWFLMIFDEFSPWNDCISFSIDPTIVVPIYL